MKRKDPLRSLFAVLREGEPISEERHAKSVERFLREGVQKDSFNFFDPKLNEEDSDTMPQPRTDGAPKHRPEKRK